MSFEKPVKITENLFLGGINSTKNIEYLKEIGITDIINLAGKPNMMNDFARVYEAHFPDENDFDIKPIFMKTIDYMEGLVKDERKKNVKMLVHCLGGVSRSPSLVIGFLMKTMKLNYEDAFKLVKGKKKGIHPNSSFVKQLKELEPLLLL